LTALTAARSRYDEYHRQYTDLIQTMGLDPTQSVDTKGGSRGDPSIARLNRRKTERDDLESDLEGKLGSLAELEARRAEEPEFVATVVEEPGVDLSADIIEYQAQIRDLQIEQRRLTPANRQFAAIEQEIERLERHIEDARRLEKPPTERLVSELNPAREELEDEIAQAKAEIAGVRGSLRKVNSLITELQRQAENDTENYLTLRTLDLQRGIEQDQVKENEERLAQIRIQLQLLKDIHQRPFEIVMPPRASETPTEPNPTVIVVFALIAGLAFGLGLAMLGEFGGNAFRSPSELQEVMAVPVLGTVNRIVTRAEIRTQHARRAIVGSSSAVILGGLAWFTYVWASAPDKLPIRVLRAIDGLRDMLM